MKNILYVLVFVLLASSVCAAASFTASNLDFGSDTQSRSVDVTLPLTLTNTGDVALTIALTSTLKTTYNTVIAQPSVTLAPGATTNVDITISIPKTQSSQKTDLSGGIVGTAVSGNSTVARTSHVTITTESMLEINKVTIMIDGGSEKTMTDSDFTDSDLKAGTSFVIRVYAKNDYATSTSIDMTGVEASISSDSDLNLDDTQSIGDINPTHKEFAEFSGQIPTDAQDGDTYSIDVSADGVDDNGAEHYASTSRDIRVERKTDEISITKYKITPQTISCNGKVTISATLQNTGRYNEASTFLLIENDELGIMEKFYSLAMQKDDSVSKTYSFNIDNTTAPGSYDFMLTTFYGSDKQSTSQVVTLNVDPCQQTQPTQPTIITTPTNTNTNTQPTIPQVVPINGATPAYGNASFTDSPTYLVVLIAAVVVILLILIILLVKFVF